MRNLFEFGLPTRIFFMVIIPSLQFGGDPLILTYGSIHILIHIDIETLTFNINRLRCRNINIATRRIQMYFISRFIGNQDTFVFCENNLMRAFGHNIFTELLLPLPSAVPPWNIPPITKGRSGRSCIF